LYKIVFYQDPNGNQPALDFIMALSQKDDKNSRINLNKINDYIEMLKVHGTIIGEPYVKHLEDKLWELRPLSNRFIFVAWVDGTFVFLHHFIKKSRKTPKREIDQAKRELSILMGRGESDE